MHILVVEDERALCETVVRSLRRLAYSVDFCFDGNRAAELLGVERYDLVLLDLKMPEQTIIWQSRFIWRSWRQGSAV